MKRRICIVLIVLFALLLLPHAASANAPAPDPTRIKVEYRNVEGGTVVRALFAGDDGVFHASESGTHTVSENNAEDVYYRLRDDTQMYLELTHPDGTVIRSNTLSIDVNTHFPSFRYDGKTNELKDRSNVIDNSPLVASLLYMMLVLAGIAAAFGITLLIEFLVGLCFRMKPFHYIIIANLITNIPMNFVLLWLRSFIDGGGVYWIALVILELIVCGFEFWFYTRKYRDRKKWVLLIFTLTANAMSAAAGLLPALLLFR